MSDLLPSEVELRKVRAEIGGLLPGWTIEVVTAAFMFARSPTYDLDGVVIHAQSAQELVERVRVQVRVEALALGRQGRIPPGGVLCGVDFTGLVADRLGEPEADQFTIRTEGQLHMPGAVLLYPPRPPLGGGTVEMYKRPNGSWWSTLEDPWPVFINTIRALMEWNANGFVLTWSASERKPPAPDGSPAGEFLDRVAQAAHTTVQSAAGPLLKYIDDLAANVTAPVPPPHAPAPAPPKPAVPQGRVFGFEGDPCPECGTMTMVRNGSCLKCVSCGATTGCS